MRFRIRDDADMVVDYVKRQRAAGRGQDEEAERIAGERGYANAAEMEAGENQREREMASFHDVAAAGREADGARADLLADARARLSDPNASEFDKQAARAVLRFRQRDGRDGVTAQGTEGEGVRFRHRAPNGKESNLDERQYDEVRTDNFKKWFGDWERVAQRDYILSDKYVTSLKGDEFAKTDEPLTDRVAKYYSDNYDGQIERENFGVVILDRRGVKDSISHGIGRTKSAAFAAVPEIIRDGIQIDQQENWKGRNQDSFTFAAPIEIGGKGHVGIVIVTRGKGSQRNRFYLHEVVIQENLQNESIKTGTKADSHHGDVAKVLKEIATAKNSSKIVDENGEPLVVYHQTNRKQYINRETGQNWDDLDWREREEWDRRSDEEWEAAWEEQDFYTFDNRYARQSVEYPGFFFSPRYDEYHEYGDRTIAAYLDMKNPAIDPDIPNAGVTDTAGRDAMESLMRQGYDGVIRTEDGVPYEYIVFHPEQIKSATENNGDFSRESGDIRFRLRDEERRPTFYSNAERAVENVKQGKATAEQWKAMLTKAGGIKAGEDKWMGLTDWLDEHKGQSLTKDEVLQFVRDNGIRMEEVNYGGDEQDRWRRIWDNLSWSELYNTAVRRIDERGGDSEEWDNVNDEIQDILTERYGEQVFDHIDYDSEGNIELKGNEIHSIREDYTTPGLENKREIAFVVPGIEPYQENDAVHFGPENKGRAVMWVRFGETTDKDGKRVLVIDEVQSNRHQDARERGYITKEQKDADKALKEYISELKEKYGIRYYNQLSPQERLKFNQLTDSANDIARGGIPAAPFEKNWMEVAMKRMLRLAAEEGFDKVAWTTGAQQASRYNLNKVIDRIWHTDDLEYVDGGKRVMLRKDEGLVIPFTVDSNGIVAKGYSGNSIEIPEGTRLSDVVGKELADKIMSGSGEVIENPFKERFPDLVMKEISGDGLRIGGDGMKGFYDEMLPRFMNKYGKKWGSQVGEVELATPGGEVMHSVDVTEPMRDSVLQGQPLFRIRGEHETGDRVREKEEKGYHSLFDGIDDREEQSRPSIERERVGLKEQLARSSDDDLLREIGESSAEDRTFYSEEYDRRHLKEYNEMCDNYRKMLDDGKVEFEQAEEMLLDAIHDWREGHASAERTRLLAQFDTLNAYYAEKQEEAREREDAEHGGAVESAISPRGGEQAPLPTAPTPTFDPTAIVLRQLADGETSHVQRRYERSGQFDFTGSERIESADDVAYIFRNLENSAIENVFLVLVKDGRGTILHVGMGGYRTSLGHLGAGYLAASELRPDKVVMVHNHPSGSLEPSGDDLELHNKVVRMFGDDVVAPSIIIDTTRGEYSEFEAMADLEIKSRKRSSVGEIPYDTYTFSRQVFAPGYNPATAFTVRSSEDVAKFVSSHRLGERPKVSLIVLDNRNHVVGNVFLPYTELKAADASRVSDETARYVHQMGGNRAILYGRVGSVDVAAVKSIKSALRDRDVSLVDFIDVNRGSYNDRGVLNEAGARYDGSVSEEDINDAISRAKRDAELMPDPIEFTKENWDKAFPAGKVTTPIGEVSLGAHQFEKMQSKGRTAEVGLMKATLERPDFVIEENAPNESAERQSNYLFVKTFVKDDGTTYRHYESVTISRDGGEVVVSSHYISENKLRSVLKDGNLIYKKEDSQSSNGSEMRLAETQSGRSDLLPTPDDNESYSGKGSENSADGQADGGETTNFRVRGDASGETADHTTAVEDARRRLESGDASEFERQAAQV